MINKALFTSKSDEWSTPQNLYDELNKEFGFTLDPCASDKNHKCEKYFTIEDNGLCEDWTGEVVFCNPPYSKIKDWVEKAYIESNGCVVVLLIPSRTDTKYFHEYIYNKYGVEIRFIKGRLKFSDSKNSAPFPSMIVVFDRRGDAIYREDHFYWWDEVQQYKYGPYDTKEEAKDALKEYCKEL